MALTPEERGAISDLFARVQANGPADKDAEAEALINQLMRRTPDSAYILVQTTLVQEAHIEDLEARIDELEAQLAANGRTQSRGGFLGGARRSAAPRDDYVEDRRSGIPPIGSRSAPSAYEPAPQPAWRGSRDEPPNARPGTPPQREGGGGGGFFRTAAAMAAGVAGGTLLANSLGGMFGGGKGGDAQAGQSDSASHESGHQDASDNDPGNYDADYHDAGVEEGDWGAGMDDIDI
jgi:hypothetical protein